MNPERRKKLEAKGWTVGNADDFLEDIMKPEQFKSVDQVVNDVNMTKLKSMEPNETTIAAINEDRDELESVEGVDEEE